MCGLGFATLDFCTNFSWLKISFFFPQNKNFQQERVLSVYLCIHLQSKLTLLFRVTGFQMADRNCLVWGLFWLVVLVFPGWPTGIALCALYEFFSPLATLIGLDELSEVLLKGAFGEAAGSECVRWQAPVLSNGDSPASVKQPTVCCWIS